MASRHARRRRSRPRAARGPSLALGASLAAACAAGEPPLTPLPEPLSLVQALALADQPHPELARQRADLALRRAEVQAAESRDGLEAHVLARARWVETRPSADDDYPGDLLASLRLSKRLYDFGRTRAHNAAARLELAGEEARLVGVRQRRRLAILGRFFDVLLADLAYARDNEAMSIAFVRLDRDRDRQALEQISEVELLRREDIYQSALAARTRSATEQRATRARLALALNRPGQLPGDLVEPELVAARRERPEVEDLQARALADNPSIRALIAHVQAARAQVQAARAERRPILTGELEAAAYNRKLRSRDPLRAGVSLELPLYQGGRVRAEVARQEAMLSTALADLEARRLAVRQAVLEAWLELESVAAERRAAEASDARRELELDRSRALYELEVNSDLGDAMVETSRVRYRRARLRYETARSWARLDALTGVDPARMVVNLLGEGR